jgi:urease accessory protein
MQRVFEIKSKGDWGETIPVDRVVLDADERHRRRIVLTGEKGTDFLLDLEHSVALQNGDGLVLEDGSIIEVVGRAEPLVEISAASREDVVRLAWHIGNRHAEMQIFNGRLRIRRDHVLEEMLRTLGASLTPIEVLFEPERGAYAHSHDTNQHRYSGGETHHHRHTDNGPHTHGPSREK